MNDVTIATWLEGLASKTPTPGGGAVAALAAAISAAQLGMVASYTTGPKWQLLESRMLELIGETTSLRERALELVGEDAAAFANVRAAYQLSKLTDDEKAARQTVIQQALTQATVPPTQTAQVAIRLLDIAAEIAASGNPNVISDVLVASSMARASLESALINIEINDHSINDPDTKKKLQKFMHDAAQSIKNADIVNKTVWQRMNTA